MNNYYTFRKKNCYHSVVLTGIIFSFVSCTLFDSNVSPSPTTSLNSGTNLPSPNSTIENPLETPTYELSDSKLTFTSTPLLITPTISPTVTSEAINHLTLLNTYEIQSSYFEYFPNGNRIAYTQRERVVVFDLAEQKEIYEVTIRPADQVTGIREMAISPDGKWLAASDFDGLIYLWNANDGVPYRELRFFTEPAVIKFSPNGKLLAVGSAGEVPGLVVWNIEDGRTIGSFNNFAADITFSPTGDKFATTDFLWSGTGTLIHLIDVISFANQNFFEITEGANESHFSESLSFSTDGQQLAAIIDSKLYIWDLDTQAELNWTKSVNLAELRSVYFSPTGLLVTVDVNELISLFHLSNGELVGVIENIMKTDINRNIPLPIAFSPDGTKIMTGGAFAILQEWQMPK